MRNIRAAINRKLPTTSGVGESRDAAISALYFHCSLRAAPKHDSNILRQ